MDYTLEIKEIVDNPEFVPYEPQFYHDNRKPEQREPVIEKRVLFTEVSEEQFNAIRKAVLDKF